MTARNDFNDAETAAWAAHRARLVRAHATFNAAFSSANATYGNVAANHAAFDTAVKAAQQIFDAAKADSETVRSCAVTVARDTARVADRGAGLATPNLAVLARAACLAPLVPLP